MLFIDAAQVAARLDRRRLIDALDAAFRAPHSIPGRHHHSLAPTAAGPGGGVLLLMPAWDGGDALGVKLVTVFPDNGARGLPSVCASYVLMDRHTGKPHAFIDGTELTLRRTAAASALASRHLSRPESTRLLMVGTGNLAPHLIASHALVRPLTEVRLWGRNRARTAALARALHRSDLGVEPVDDLEAGVRWADLISCATLSQQPLVRGAWLAPGQHVDLVGAYTPAMCEADDEALARSELYVDTRAGALHEAGEIVGAIARGAILESAVRAELADLSRGTFRRPTAASITLFKSVGTALEDLVAARLIAAAPLLATAPPAAGAAATP